MKTITKEAVYNRLPISQTLYLEEAERKIYETDIKNKQYKGFNIEFVEHLNLDETHIRFIIKKINGKKVDVHSSEVRKYVDNVISRVFERINGRKESCLDDVFFTKESYIEKMKNESIEETATRLLINARYNGKQFNWCFEYLYSKGVSIAILAEYL